MTNNYKTSISAILIALFLSCFGEVLAQNFTNNANGSYNAAPEAVIRMKDATGTFSGTAALGSATSRIQGTVDWAATGAQAIQVAYYTNLTATGGAKTIADGIHVGGAGSANPLPAYSNMKDSVCYYPTNASRTYTGTFFYDSTAAQLIFAENGSTAGTDRYNNLDLTGGSKTTAGNITMDGLLAVHTAASMLNKWAFALGTGASTIEGNVTNSGIAGTSSFTTTGSGTVNVRLGAIFLVDGGTLAMQSTGHFTVEADGNLTLATGANGDGKLAMSDLSYFEDAGTFLNTATDHANMTFADASTVLYSGTSGDQNVVASVNTDPATNRYSTLIFTGGANKVLEAGTDADLYTRSNVSVSGGNLVISNTNTNNTDRNLYTDATGTSKISFPDQADMPYIQGNIVLAGTIAATVPYTLNNYETQVTFKTVPATFGFNVQSAIAPTKLNDFSALTDVSRSIYANFANGTDNAIISNLRVGYATSDLIGFTGDQGNMRFTEGFDANFPMQKITGGKGIATNSGTTPATTHWVNLVTNEIDAVELVASAVNGGTTKQLVNGSNVVLTSTPLMFIAVNNGRWTNPNTWDEGIYPSSIDNTIIRALVYTGINGPAYGTLAAGNETSEDDVYVTNKSGEARTFNGALAHSITIDADPTPGDGQPYALIIGNSDLSDGSKNPSDFLFKTAYTGTVSGMAAGVFNNNNAGTNNGDWDNTGTTPGSGNTIFGLFVSRVGNSATNTSTFGTGQITNAGVITNHSVIEIGN